LKTTYLYSLEGKESERLFFRRITEHDFDTWVAFCEYPDSLKYIFSQEQLKVEDPVERCKMWFKRVFDRYENGLGGMNALIDKQTGAMVGQCGLLVQTMRYRLNSKYFSIPLKSLPFDLIKLLLSCLFQ